MAYGYPQYYPQIPYYNAQQTAMPDQLAQLRAAQQPMMQQPAQPSSNGLIWVQGEAGAKSYLVANGSSVLLMDSEKQTFYIKSADAAGMPSMRTFDYTERNASVKQPSSSAQDAPEYRYSRHDGTDKRLMDELEELMRTIEPGKRDVIRRALEELKEA